MNTEKLATALLLLSELREESEEFTGNKLVGISHLYVNDREVFVNDRDVFMKLAEGHTIISSPYEDPSKRYDRELCFHLAGWRVRTIIDTTMEG